MSPKGLFIGSLVLGVKVLTSNDTFKRQSRIWILSSPVTTCQAMCVFWCESGMTVIRTATRFLLGFEAHSIWENLRQVVFSWPGTVAHKVTGLGEAFYHGFPKWSCCPAVSKYSCLSQPQSEKFLFSVTAVSVCVHCWSSRMSKNGILGPKWKNNIVSSKAHGMRQKEYKYQRMGEKGFWT